MQSKNQDLSSKNHASKTPVLLSEATLKNLTKPVELAPVKDISLERLLASCCDCV